MHNLENFLASPSRVGHVRTDLDESIPYPLKANVCDDYVVWSSQGLVGGLGCYVLQLQGVLLRGLVERVNVTQIEACFPRESP